MSIQLTLRSIRGKVTSVRWLASFILGIDLNFTIALHIFLSGAAASTCDVGPSIHSMNYVHRLLLVVTRDVIFVSLL